MTDSSETLVPAFIAYLRAERRCSEHTIKAYKEDLNQVRIFLFGLEQSPNWLQVEAAELSRYLVWLQHRGLAKTSINRKISAIRSFYRYLRKKGWGVNHPLKDISNLRVAEKTPRFLTAKQAEGLKTLKFGEDFSGYRDKLMLGLFLWTGMRSMELIGLRLEDIDLARAQLRVIGKGRKARVLPLHGMLVEQFKKYLEQRSLFLEEKGGDRNALFLNDKGEPLKSGWLYRRVRFYTSELTLESYRGPHLLRHSFATWMLNNGADIQAVKELLGHANLAATQVYTHVEFERMRDIYKKAHPKGSEK
jgi:integrase/recombinase XerC